MIATPRPTPHWRTCRACSIGSGTAPRQPPVGPWRSSPTTSMPVTCMPCCSWRWAGSTERYRRSTTPLVWTHCRHRSIQPTVECCIVPGDSTTRAFASSERSNWNPATQESTHVSRTFSSNWADMTLRSACWIRSTYPDVTRTPVPGARARILARAGRAKEARQLLAQLPPQSPARAEVLAALGDHDAAFNSLFRALDQRDSWPLFIKSDPVFEGMHRDARWADLLRRMNLGE